VHERTTRVPAYRNVELGRYGGRLPIREVRIPPLNVGEAAVHISSRRVFSPTAHTYDINSLSACSDAATFLSADDLRINLWSLDNPRLCFNIVDLKPTATEDLMELINTAKFHPTSCSTFAYSTSKGSLRVGDIRASALCDTGVKSYGNPGSSSSSSSAAGGGGGGGEGAGGGRSYIGQIISSLTGIEFSGDGRYIVGRDYMTVKVWDLAQDREPCAVFPVQEPLRPHLPALYDNDSIFEKFQVSWGMCVCVCVCVLEVEGRKWLGMP
jgi:serine/threonine-protein phosphatase 2A regulatory subunit B